MNKRTFLALIPAAALLAAGCTDQRSHSQAVYMLVDTSGTYAQEASKAQVIINYLLGSLQPGDSLAVARVTSRSFSEKDIIAKATFDSRPSQENAQKRAFRERIDNTFRSVPGSRHTDITGGLMQGSEFLNETGAGHKTMLSGVDRGQLPFSVDTRRMRLLWPVMRFLASSVLTLGTPIGRKVAPKVRAHGGPLLRVRRADLERAGVRRYPARTDGVRDGRPVLADGTVLDVANVIWCTGYRPDFSFIELPIFDEYGWPHQTRGVAESAPGLYFLGLPFLYAFASMLVLGAARDAKFVVERVAEQRAVRSRRVEAASEPAS